MSQQWSVGCLSYGRRPPHTGLDKWLAWGEIYDLAHTDAKHSVHAGLDKEGEMRIGTQAPIGHQYIPCLQARMDRLHVGQVVGQKGCDDQLEESTLLVPAWKDPRRCAMAKP